MILADTSVWIDYLHDRNTSKTRALRDAASQKSLLVGDLILLEILQGARDDNHAAHIERVLVKFTVSSLLDASLAVSAARNYRKLRSLGITIRKTVDLIIGTFCIERGHVLLHDDRDFAPMEKHLGLKVL